MEIIINEEIIRKDVREIKLRSKNGTTISFMENTEGDLILTNK